MNVIGAEQKTNFYRRSSTDKVSSEPTRYPLLSGHQFECETFITKKRLYLYNCDRDFVPKKKGLIISFSNFICSFSTEQKLAGKTGNEIRV